MISSGPEVKLSTQIDISSKVDGSMTITEVFARHGEDKAILTSLNDSRVKVPLQDCCAQR